MPKAKHFKVELEPGQEPEDTGEPAHGENGSIHIVRVWRDGFGHV
jgi:hypothetical protein